MGLDNILPHNATLSDVADKYDAILCDLWGVIHDGQDLYPGALKGLTYLKKRGVKTVFLSNAPRRSHIVKQRMKELGVADDLYIDVLTSGETVRHLLGAGALAEPPVHYMLVGERRDGDICDGLPHFERVHSLKAANLVVITGYNDETRSDEKMRPILEDLAKSGKTVICANPDKFVVRLSGEKEYCAGRIAERFRDMGGDVVEIGKPYSDIYKYALSRYFKGIDKERIACIGDNMDTDIRGAVDSGMDAYLITDGIHADAIEKSGTAKFLADYPVSPTGIMSGFAPAE